MLNCVISLCAHVQSRFNAICFVHANCDSIIAICSISPFWPHPHKREHRVRPQFSVEEWFSSVINLYVFSDIGLPFPMHFQLPLARSFLFLSADCFLQLEQSVLGNRKGLACKTCNVGTVLSGVGSLLKGRRYYKRLLWTTSTSIMPWTSKCFCL